MIIIKHKGDPKRISRWIWDYPAPDTVRWEIKTHIAGCYQAALSNYGEMNRYDFESNLKALRSLSPEFFEVQEI